MSPEIGSGAVVALVSVLVTVLAAVVGWLVRRVWHIQMREIPDLQSDINRVKNSYFGVEGDPGGGRLDDLGDIQDSLEEIQDDQEKMQDDIDDIVEVLHRNDMNGGLPDDDE